MLVTVVTLRYASVSSVHKGAKTHQIANQKRGYIEKYVKIIYGCEVRRKNRSRSFAVLFDKLSRVERQSRPRYKSAILIDGFHCDVIKL